MYVGACKRQNISHFAQMENMRSIFLFSSYKSHTICARAKKWIVMDLIEYYYNEIS